MYKNKFYKKFFFIILIFFIEISLLPACFSLLSEDGSWLLKNSMFTHRIGHGVVSCNGKIYVIGGYNNGFLDLVEVYDPLNDSWTFRKSMPFGVAEFGICSVGSNIYVIGGCNELMKKGESIYPSNVLNTVLVYDTILDSWSLKTSMPTPRNSLALGVVNDKIYAIGGAGLLWNDCCFYFYKALDVNEVYNIENNSWESLPNLPTPRHHICVTVFDDEIFVCGGNTGADLWPPDDKVEIYSTDTNSWRTGVSLPKKLTSFGISSIDYNFYIIGGICSPEYQVNDVFRFNTLNNQWYNSTSISQARFGFGACSNNGKIYIIGGGVDGIRSIYTVVNFSDLNEEFTPVISDVINKPNIDILSPSENCVVSGSINISGSASSINSTLKYIQIKIGSNPWVNINVSEIWVYPWDTTGFDDGNYIISARSFNGVSYSSIDTLNITVKNTLKEDKESPGFEIIIIFTSIIIIYFLKKKLR